MSGDEESQELGVELPMIAEDDGNTEAARFRIGLAMVSTMLAEAADKHGGKLPSSALHGIASDIITGNERGIAFVSTHVGRMMGVRIVAPSEGSS
jgi:hypothetical protein